MECEVLEQMKNYNFIEISMDILVDFCSEKSYHNSIEPNVPPSLLERRSEMEVRAQKSTDVRVSPTLASCRDRPPPSAALVASLCDVLHNASAFQQCPVQEWNEHGMYRLLFRCASWTTLSHEDNNLVRGAACRALVAAASDKSLRTTLASTKDCVHALLQSLAPEDAEQSADVTPDAYAQGLLLLSVLLQERAGDAVWNQLVNGRHSTLFVMILHAMEDSDDELQNAALYCLTHLAQSAERKKHADKTKDETCIQHFDNIKAPSSKDNFASGDSGCRPEYMVEQYCKILIQKYQYLAAELNNYQSNPEDPFTRTSVCLASLLACSPRSREYATHRSLHRVILTIMQGVRDKLTLQGKPVDVIRSASSHPILRTLHLLLVTATSLMLQSPRSKELFSEDSAAVSLTRLWPWTMLTDGLRVAVMKMLVVWTNGCAKAWSAMCSCISGRSLLLEVCTLLNKEASLQSKPRAGTLLVLCVDTLRQCMPNQHCRAIVLKSEVLSSLHKCRRSPPSTLRAWFYLCEAAARSAEGSLSVLALKPLQCAAGLRAGLLPAVAHAAMFHRNTFLQAPDLLEFLSGTLLSGDHSEMVSAGRAVWALAANNHRAKLMLRSAGVVNAVQSALLRVQRNNDPDSQMALQILTNTNTVLHAN